MTIKGKYFIDRDGHLFKYILDYLRNGCELILPENFNERDRLLNEAEFYRLDQLSRKIKDAPFKLHPLTLCTSRTNDYLCGFITVGYRGSFVFGRDIQFRKLNRILIAGKALLCREVFGDTLNESRDPDHNTSQNRYTSRFFLKHTILEQCFDALMENGFRCVTSCGSGTSGNGSELLKPGVDTEESQWNHYNEFVFCRP